MQGSGCRVQGMVDGVADGTWVESNERRKMMSVRLDCSKSLNPPNCFRFSVQRSGNKFYGLWGRG